LVFFLLGFFFVFVLKNKDFSNTTLATQINVLLAFLGFALIMYINDRLTSSPQLLTQSE